MDRYVHRSKEGGRTVKESATAMAPVAEAGSEIMHSGTGVEMEEVREEGSHQKSTHSGISEENREEFNSGTIDYKRLAREMAAYLAEDFKTAVKDLVQSTTQELHMTITQHEAQLHEAEQRISEAEDKIVQLEQQVSRLQKQAEYATEKMEDLENRSRRNNLKIIGLPETITPRQLDEICECEIPKALGLSHKCTVERAHRIGPPRDQVDNGAERNRQSSQEWRRPRQVVSKYLNYKDKEELLRTFKSRKQPLIIQGHKILLFGDFSVEVSKKRRAFSEVCTMLYKKNVRFQLNYPAILRFRTPDGAIHALTDPKEAMYLATQRASPQGDRNQFNQPRKSANREVDDIPQRPDTESSRPSRPESETRSEERGEKEIPREQKIPIPRSAKKGGQPKR